jgi:hypothetical protein
LARVEKEARVLVGRYTRLEHEACATLPNNGRWNHVLELAGVAYGPHPTPISMEVLKKRKADSVEKTVPKHPKALEKKWVDHAKTSAAHGKIGVKQPSDANVASLKSAKLSKKTIPRTIASTTAAHGTLMASRLKTALGASDPVAAGGASGFKVTGGGLVSKGAAGSKKAIVPIKKHLVSLIGPMARASSEESQDSSLCDQTIQTVAPEIPLRSKPHGQSPPASVLRANPLAVLQTTTPFGVGRASISFCRLSAIAFVCVVE